MYRSTARIKSEDESDFDPVATRGQMLHPPKRRIQKPKPINSEDEEYRPQQDRSRYDISLFPNQSKKRATRPNTARIHQFMAKNNFRIPGGEAIQALVDELGNTSVKNVKKAMVRMNITHNEQTEDSATISALVEQGHPPILPARAKFMTLDCMLHDLQIFADVTRKNYNNSPKMKAALASIAIKINQPTELLAMFVRDEKNRFARRVTQQKRTSSRQRVFRTSATPNPDYDKTAHTNSLFSSVDEGECDPARPSRPIKVQENDSVGVSSARLEKMNPTREDVISDISDLSNNNKLQKHKDAGLAVPDIIRDLIAATQVGQQAETPTWDSDGSPKLKGKVKELWEIYLAADKALAAKEGRKWTKSKFSSPWGNINSGLILLLHYPPLGASQSMYKFHNACLGLIGLKLGLEDMASSAGRHGALHLDLKSAMTNKKKHGHSANNQQKIRPHEVDFAFGMWRECTARVGLIWGLTPRKVYTKTMRDRTIMAKKIAIPCPGGMNKKRTFKAHIFFAFASTQDRINGNVCRIVFCLPHPEYFLLLDLMFAAL